MIMLSYRSSNPTKPPLQLVKQLETSSSMCVTPIASEFAAKGRETTSPVEHEEYITDVWCNKRLTADQPIVCVSCCQLLGRSDHQVPDKTPEQIGSSPEAKMT
jgi:hypothetical protein